MTVLQNMASFQGLIHNEIMQYFNGLHMTVYLFIYIIIFPLKITLGTVSCECKLHIKHGDH